MRLFAFCSICCVLRSLCLAQWEPNRKLSTTDSAATLNENMARCIVTYADTVHVTWCDTHQNGSAIYYKRNQSGNVGIDEGHNPLAASQSQGATFVRGVLRLSFSPPFIHSSLFDMTGRRVMALRPGANEIGRLSPGLYFVRGAQNQVKAQPVRKAIVTG